MIVEKWPMYLIFHMMGVGILIGMFRSSPWTVKFTLQVAAYFTLVHLVMGLVVYVVKNEFPGEWEAMKPEAQDFGP